MRTQGLHQATTKIKHTQQFERILSNMLIMSGSSVPTWDHGSEDTLVPTMSVPSGQLSGNARSLDPGRIFPGGVGVRI